MATTQHATQHVTGQAPHRKNLKARVQPLINFWKKLSNDWVFNLSGLLAYNILMSIFPILLALLAVAGFILNTISPGSQQQLVNAIAGALPGGSEGSGGAIVTAALNNLQRQAGVLFVIALLTAIFTGSRLFVTIENCFGVIFRLRGRGLIRQNLMAIGMLLLYVVLVPIIFLASFVPTAIVNTLNATGGVNGLSGLLIHLVGILASFVVAVLLFSAIYVVVPNRPVRFSEIWKGTILASALLVLYELLFPIYESLVLKPGNYGALAGFALVIMIFFYYLAVILLLGAEVNSWMSGQRETASDIAAIMHEVQAHDTTRGAGGPTAGQPQEDLKDHEGKEAMATRGSAQRHEQIDHRRDTRPETVQPGKAGSIGTDQTNTATSAGDGARLDGQPIQNDTRDTHAAPYAHDAGRPQAHQPATPVATRHEQGLARPDAGMRRRATLGALGVAAGVAATALWLERRR